MSDVPNPELQQQLAELTSWTGPAPQLWRRAMKSARQAAGGTGRLWAISRRIPSWLVVGAAAAAIFIVVGIVVSTPRYQRLAAPGAGEPSARRSEPASERWSEFGGFRAGTVMVRDDTRQASMRSYDMAMAGRPVVEATAGDTVHSGEKLAYGSVWHTVPADEKYPDGPAVANSSNSVSDRDTSERQVVRKATIELATKDVRAAFAKAVHLISEAQGEFVQESGLTGTDKQTEGVLTLRVAVSRLAEVLNELRELGEVRSERSSGEDVTAQVVDIEARLRNEQRVEKELLELLEKRADAPLKEILELRNSISSVRQSIEQLIAQREKLSRLVSLATVLVIIRPADAPPPQTPDTGMWTRFVHVIGQAWRKGVLFLMDTLGGILSVLVGGLIWWILLLVAVVVFRAYRRRRTA